jgi:pyridoxine/pyridoxamine 5'-phosphate oxidase
VRHVLVKGIDERGLAFYTNRDSGKGRHLAENPNAAIAPCIGGSSTGRSRGRDR